MQVEAVTICWTISEVQRGWKAHSPLPTTLLAAGRHLGPMWANDRMPSKHPLAKKLQLALVVVRAKDGCESLPLQRDK